MNFAGEGDKAHLQPLQGFEQTHDLFGFAAVGDGQESVAAGEHAHIPVKSFGRVQEKGGGSRAGECCGDFSSDEAGFSHAGDHDAAFAGEQKVHRFFEAGIETRQDVLNRLRFDFENAARGVEAHGWPHMTPKSRINRKGTIYRAPTNRQIGGASRWLNPFSSDEPRCLVLSISPTGRGAAPGEERSGRRTKPLRDCHESPGKFHLLRRLHLREPAAR